MYVVSFWKVLGFVGLFVFFELPDRFFKIWPNAVNTTSVMFGGEGFSVFSPPDWSGFESAKVFYSGNKIPQIRF